jgi:hypothetical protein
VDASHRITVGGDKAYDTADFVAQMRDLGVTPHVAHNTKGRQSAIDGRPTRHPGYGISRKKRKRIEEVFGWMKSSPASARLATEAPSGSAGCSR